MNRLNKIAILSELIEGLQQQGSWCGETHIQKATYFLQELLEVPTEFTFILYKHGPFSFDLRDELSAMQADSMLAMVIMPAPYGPSLKPTEESKTLRTHFPVTLGKYEEEIDFIVQALGTKDVGQLERLATALYVMLNPEGEQTDEERAARIHRYKPHISIESARDAINDVKIIMAQTHQFRSSD